MMTVLILSDHDGVLHDNLVLCADFIPPYY